MLPASFLAMPRWWTEGADWLAGLVTAVADQCDEWELEVDGPVAHGSNAIVVPVVRTGEPLVLRMSPPGREVAEQVRALQWWDGRGMVRLYDADPDRGAMLLERLRIDQPLRARPVAEAVAVLGELMRRLAVPAPSDVPTTASIVRDRVAELQQAWDQLGRPFDAAFLQAAEAVAPRLSETPCDLCVNGDLHSDQVLRGSREPWIAVDPVLLRGDAEYDLARVLWTRIDEMAGPGEIVEHFGTAVTAAGLDRDRARDWVVFRTVDYWLWGLAAGLTEDPPRCRRLLTAFLD